MAERFDQSEARLQRLISAYAEQAVMSFDPYAVADRAMTDALPLGWRGRAQRSLTLAPHFAALLLLALLLAALVALGVGAPDRDPPLLPRSNGLIVVTAHVPDGTELELLDSRGALVRRLTETPLALEAQPTWSPDGSLLAFLREGPEGRSLWVTAADGSGMRELISGGGLVAPRWSPTGEAIGVVDEEAGILLVVDRSGTRLNSVPGAYDFSWSPDGRQVVFVDGAGGRGGDVRRVDLESGAVVALTDDSAWDTEPAWSPSGDAIAFISSRDDRADRLGPGIMPAAVFLMTPSGDGVEPLGRDLSALDRGLAWSPDGSKLAFVRSWVSSETGIIDRGAVVVYDRNTGALDEVASFDAGDVTWAPDGSALAFVAGSEGRPSLWLVASDGSDLRELPISIADLDWQVSFEDPG